MSGGNTFEVDIADRAGGGNAVVNVNGGVATTGVGTSEQSGIVNPGNNGLNNVGDRVLAGFLTSPLEFGFNNNSAGVWRWHGTGRSTLRCMIYV